jgi:hypothetical protein
MTRGQEDERPQVTERAAKERQKGKRGEQADRPHESDNNTNQSPERMRSEVGRGGGRERDLQDEESSPPGISREDALGRALLAHVALHPDLVRIERDRCTFIGCKKSTSICIQISPTLETEDDSEDERGRGDRPTRSFEN